MTDLVCAHCHQPQVAHLLTEVNGNIVCVCPSTTWQAPQEANPQNVEKNPQRKDYGVYSPEVERDLSERYTTEPADVGVHEVAYAAQGQELLHHIRLTEAAEVALATMTRELATARQESDQWQAAAHAKEASRAEAQGRWLSMRQQRDDTEAQLVVVTRERDEWKALASVGTWHLDCRPNRHKAADEIWKSQQRIDTLATQLAAMTAERDRARDQLAGCCACQHDGRGALTSECQEHQEQREALATLRTALARLVWRWKNGHSIGSISDACADELDRLLRGKATEGADK